MALLYSRVPAGVTMEPDLLARLLAGDDEASVAALAALCSGASYVGMGVVTSTESLARIYGRRLRHTHRKGIEILGLDRAVQLLGRHDQPVRLGQVIAADGSWAFMLFLTADGRALVACTGVRQTDE